MISECILLHVLTDLLWKWWELVDMLAGVLTAGDAEAELKVEALQQLISEVMPLNHAEVIDRNVTHCELDT